MNLSYWSKITKQIALMAYQITATIIVPITPHHPRHIGMSEMRGEAKLRSLNFLFTITTIPDHSIIFRQRVSGQICAASNEACVKMRGCLVSLRLFVEHNKGHTEINNGDACQHTELSAWCAVGGLCVHWAKDTGLIPSLANGGKSG